MSRSDEQWLDPWLDPWLIDRQDWQAGPAALGGPGTAPATWSPPPSRVSRS